MPVADVRNPSLPSPPDPPKTTSSGRGPKRVSSCVWFLACALATPGSAFGRGGGAAWEVWAGLLLEVGLSSWYSQAPSATPEPVTTSKSAMAHDQRFPPIVAMPPPYRHRFRHSRRPGPG